LYKKSENYTRNITGNLPEEILIEQNILEKKSKNHKELSNQPYVIEETNSEKDEKNLEKVFEDRQKIMKKGCNYLKYIEYLQNSPTTSFQELYNFHSFIHDINQPIEDKKEKVLRELKLGLGQSENRDRPRARKVAQSPNFCRSLGRNGKQQFLLD
jgi:hypothetical protein